MGLDVGLTTPPTEKNYCYETHGGGEDPQRIAAPVKKKNAFIILDSKQTSHLNKTHLLKYTSRMRPHVPFDNFGNDIVQVLRSTRLLSDGTGSYFPGVKGP
jgi:hypothetical protein